MSKETIPDQTIRDGSCLKWECWYSVLIVGLLTKLCVGFSHLNELKFWHNFRDAMSPKCDCDSDIESIEQFSYLRWINFCTDYILWILWIILRILSVNHHKFPNRSLIHTKYLWNCHLHEKLEKIPGKWKWMAKKVTFCLNFHLSCSF